MHSQQLHKRTRKRIVRRMLYLDTTPSYLKNTSYEVLRCNDWWQKICSAWYLLRSSCISRSQLSHGRFKVTAPARKHLLCMPGCCGTRAVARRLFHTSLQIPPLAYLLPTRQLAYSLSSIVGTAFVIVLFVAEAVACKVDRCCCETKRRQSQRDKRREISDRSATLHTAHRRQILAALLNNCCCAS